jgi:nitrogen fixation-related uncharacterized protein
VSEGQYDDLETPPQRMLCDDLEVHVVRAGEGGNTEPKRSVEELVSPKRRAIGDNRSVACAGNFHLLPSSWGQML